MFQMHFTLSIFLLFLFNKTNAIRSDYSNLTITPLAQTNLGWRYLLAYCKCITNNSGVWGTTEWCDEGQFVYAFQLDVQQWQGSAGDDTALNGVRLYCKSVFCIWTSYIKIKKSISGQTTQTSIQRA
jgi:hypothetical protein